MKVAEALAQLGIRQAWGSVTAHLVAGRVAHVVVRESVRPSADRRLAATVGTHPAVAEAVSSGESKEFVFVRVRGGKLTLLAVETHHDQE